MPGCTVTSWGENSWTAVSNALELVMSREEKPWLAWICRAAR